MKKLLLPLIMLASLALSCYGDAKIEQDGVFLCSDDLPCISGYECRTPGEGEPGEDPSNTYCYKEKTETDNTQCIDEDGDGFGAQGSNFAVCPAFNNGFKTPEEATDCNDQNDKVNPGLFESCDGIDNNCDGQIDEPRSCEEDTNCERRQIGGSILLSSCDNNTCAYRFGTTPAACVDGTFVKQGGS